MKTFLAVLFLLVPAVAQAATGAQTTTLAAGENLYDLAGRNISNAGVNSGGVQVKYEGKIKQDGQGRSYVDGKIVEVSNPSNGGSNGPIEISTNGQPLNVFLYRNGANGPITTHIDGGNANTTISGDNNEATVGGTGNTLLISGRNSSGTGTAGSGGTVTLAGTGSSFQSGGGNWTFRR